MRKPAPSHSAAVNPQDDQFRDSPLLHGMPQHADAYRDDATDHSCFFKDRIRQFESIYTGMLSGFQNNKVFHQILEHEAQINT